MKYGNKNEIKPVEIKCHDDEFENAIRKIGVELACEWFCCNDQFMKEAINTLCKRSEINNPYALKDGYYVEIKD